MVESVPGVAVASRSYTNQPRPVARSNRLAISVHDGAAALERFSADIDRLNAASRRLNPFLSSAFLSCYSLRSEYHTPGLEERLFVVRDGGRIVGCAPMRRSVEFFGPAVGPLRIRGTRLKLLAPLDTDQPGIVCAPEDEERVATALVEYLCSYEKGWGILEFMGQRPGNALHRAVHAAGGARYRARDIGIEPYSEIALSWPDLTAYFRSLVKKMRSNISRQARHLFAGGDIAAVMVEGEGATSAWFDAYCDLDDRSWKHGRSASIRRHPRRERFYREIAAGRGGLDPSFMGIVLDGVLIAGILIGSNASRSPEAHGAWCLEMAYDQSHAELGPGQLLLLLAVGEALLRGDQFLNFMQNFAYYKHRWKADLIEAVAVQLIRRSSLHNVRASLGDLRKHREGHGVDGDDDGPEAMEAAAHGARVVPTPAAQERARALAATAFAGSGGGMRRLDRAGLKTYLPFSLI